jgi:hypothetical protein
VEWAPIAALYLDAGLGISLLIGAAAFVVMRLYTRAVMRESERAAAAAGSEGRPAPAARASLPAAGPLEIAVEALENELPRAPRSETFRHADRAFRRAAGCYAIAGATHAASSTALLFYFGFYSPPRTASPLIVWACYAAVFWAWFFAAFFALGLFYGPHRRVRVLLVAVYIAMLPLLGVLLLLAGAPRLAFNDIPMVPPDIAPVMLAFARSVTGEAVTGENVSFSPLTQPTFFFTLSAMPFLIPVIAYNRFIRGTVGPLFITFALLMILGPFVVLDLVIVTVPRSTIKGLFGDAPFRPVMAICFIAAVVLAAFVVRWIVGQYRQKKLSDQTFLYDALWLSVSVWVCVYLMGNVPRFVYLIGFLPFVLYKLVLWLGLRHFVSSGQPLPNARLLFLRVFGSARRSEKLFDLLAARWRYAGSVQLISSGDIARSRFEPDEFLDFIAGRLKTRYIENSADLAQRLAEIESGPDPDGRYRVHEFFCRADAWQQTVTELMRRTELVAMDLRGFTSERRGCIFELGALIDHLPLERVVLLIDQTTDLALLRQTLQSLWAGMAPASPNRHVAAARVRLIDLTRSYPRAVRRLMQIGDAALAG